MKPETTELPSLRPEVVDDDDELGRRLEAWAAADRHLTGQMIACFEPVLLDLLDPDSWNLAVRLLGMMRAAADDQLVRAVRHAFREGRLYPLSSTEVSS